MVRYTPLERANRLRTAWDLRQEGKTFREIADHFGLSRDRARQLVNIAERHLKRPQNSQQHHPEFYEIFRDVIER